MKKGQSAMEFLMSYGWAILVALAAVAALAYFGVFSPERNLPESCIFFPGLGCTDHKVDTDGITLVVVNGMGKSVTGFQVTVLGDRACGGDSSTPVDINNGEQVVITVTCTEKPVTGMKVIRDLQLSYNEKGGLAHSKTGSLSSLVEG